MIIILKVTHNILPWYQWYRYRGVTSFEQWPILSTKTRYSKRSLWIPSWLSYLNEIYWDISIQYCENSTKINEQSYLARASLSSFSAKVLGSSPNQYLSSWTRISVSQKTDKSNSLPTSIQLLRWNLITVLKTIWCFLLYVWDR